MSFMSDTGSISLCNCYFYFLMLLIARFSVCPLPSACESAHVLSGIRAGLRALAAILSGGVAGRGGSGSACSHVLPVAQPQLPARHPGGLLPGRGHGLRGLRVAAAHWCRLQLQLQHAWVPARTRWDTAAEDSLWLKKKDNPHLFSLLHDSKMHIFSED